MKITILTLFPNFFTGFISESIIKRAIDKKLISIEIINIRDFTPYKNGQVDDTPYGGGSGMVLMCEPVVRAIESVRTPGSLVYLTSPQGQTFNDQYAEQLYHQTSHLILVCGHYEGFDERIKEFVDGEISIGDFVLTGGEIPAMAITDAIARFIPGVIDAESFQNDSFKNGLLDYPTYTKPREFRGLKVPDVLLNGNHQAISQYRQEEQLRITKEKRPDLLK